MGSHYKSSPGAKEGAWVPFSPLENVFLSLEIVFPASSQNHDWLVTSNEVYLSCHSG